MARDPKWTINEACENQSISKISVDESTEKELFSALKKSAVGLFIGSIVLLVVVSAIVFALATFAGVIIHGAKIVVGYIIVLILPIYSIYNIVHTNSAIKKGNYDFYQGQIITKTDKGYKLAGLEDQDLNFIKTKSNTNTDNYKQGDIVKIVRLDNDLSLFI